MKQRDIRPIEYDKLKLDALNEDLKFLHSQEDKFVCVNCPACNNDDKKYIFEKYGFEFYKCNKCRTVYMYNRPSEYLLREFYKNSKLYNFWNKYIFPKSELARKHNIFENRKKLIIEYCDKYKISKNNFLEIGAGYGYLGELLLEENVFNNIIAIEPNKKLFNSCKSKNINVINDVFENINFKYKFDVVVSFETIEHIFSPYNTLLKIHSIMNTEGLLYLTCPNFEGFDILTLLEKSDNIDAEHINMFNPDSIKILLNRIGFKIISVTTPGKLDVDIVKEKLLKKEIQNYFLEKLLLNQKEEAILEFQSYLVKHNLSSHMQILALKI
jgi:2-polyprenyl-3-methyl-5-hydroxy-6-metoxy-1,4-benzoquinol methylase